MAIVPKDTSGPALSPPRKRIRRKGSDATIKSKPSVESLDSCDKGAMSRLGTIDQMGTPASAVEPSPRPRKLQFSPTDSQETLIDPAKTPTHDTKSSKPSARMRTYLKNQKTKKAEAKAKIRRGKAFRESPTSMKKPAAAKATPAGAPSGASGSNPSQKSLSLGVDPKKKEPPKGQTSQQQAQPQAVETEDPGIDKLAHKLYMRYWRSVNESHFVGNQ